MSRGVSGASRRGAFTEGSRSPARSSGCPDSRTLKADSLFVSLRGERYDGHDFVAAAFAHGAAAALVEERANLACERDAVIQRDAAGFWASSLRLSMPQSRKYLLRRYIRDKNGTCQFGGLIDGH